MLLNRIANMDQDTLDVPDLWDLQMITNAGQTREFSPWGCHLEGK